MEWLLYWILHFYISILSFNEPVTGLSIPSSGYSWQLTANLPSSKCSCKHGLIYPQNAPHTQDVVTSDTWDRPYSREVAAFPAVSINLVFLWTLIQNFLKRGHHQGTGVRTPAPSPKIRPRKAKHPHPPPSCLCNNRFGQPNMETASPWEWNPVHTYTFS